jgi:hypothetical protein
MPTVLRAYGSQFDLDAFLALSRLPVCSVVRQGDPIYPASRPNGPRHDRSGVHVSVSDADFSDLARQAREVADFLQARRDEIRQLCEFPGIEDVTLDFGIERRDVPIQCDYLPPDLVRLAGALGLGIELSNYRALAAEPEG